MKRWVTAVLLSGALAVTACDDEPASPAGPSRPSESASSPSTSGSGTPSAEPSGPVEPTLPPEAEESTKAGAEAFVAYWWSLVNYATASGDTAPLRPTFTRSCSSCEAATSAIEKVYQRGGRITGRGYVIKRLRTISEPSGGWAIAADLSVGTQHVEGAGSLDQTYPAGTKSHLMLVEHLNGRWKVSSWSHD